MNKIFKVFKDDDITWITVNGKHIPIGADSDYNKKKIGSDPFNGKTPKNPNEWEKHGITTDKLTDVYDKLEWAYDPQFREGNLSKTGKFTRKPKEENIAESLKRLNKIKKEAPLEYELVRRQTLEEAYEKIGQKVNYDDLADEISVYKGTSSDKELSDIDNFTIDKSVAASFGDIVTEYKINKKDIPPIFNQWAFHEAEIIVKNARDKVRKISRIESQKKEKEMDEISMIIKDKKKQIVSGIVLVPDELDADNEFVNKDDIEQASINYMTKFADGKVHSTISHSTPVGLGSEVVLIENYIAPADIEIGDVTIRKGTWLQTYQIKDKGIWDMVEKGIIVGFSIGAMLRKQEIEN